MFEYSSPASADSVILIAPPDDVHALTVAKRIEALGAKAMLLDSSIYPSNCKLRHTVSDLAHDFELRIDSESITPSSLLGVWWRRPSGYRAAESLRELPVRRFVLDESRHAFEGWLASLGRRVINPVFADAAASRKPYQLYLARMVGLSIPETVITNVPAAARQFVRNSGIAPIIYKTLGGSSWQLFETRRLDENAKAMLDTVALAPVIFQREMTPKLDIRATIIDDSVIAVSIRPTRQAAALDCRLDLDAEIRPYELPPLVSTALIKLARSLDLRYGAADLVESDGRHVFLEINPAGQFLFAEIHGGVDISTAIAKALMARSV